jgi:hypothetical protein
VLESGLVGAVTSYLLLRPDGQAAQNRAVAKGCVLQHHASAMQS